MRFATAIFACVLFAPGVSGSSWVDRVFDQLQAGRERAGVRSLERRESLDAVAREYARMLQQGTPEPNEELEDSELSDAERQQAIARERFRRGRRG